MNIAVFKKDSNYILEVYREKSNELLSSTSIHQSDLWDYGMMPKLIRLDYSGNDWFTISVSHILYYHFKVLENGTLERISKNNAGYLSELNCLARCSVRYSTGSATNYTMYRIDDLKGKFKFNGILDEKDYIGFVFYYKRWIIFTDKLLIHNCETKTSSKLITSAVTANCIHFIYDIICLYDSRTLSLYDLSKEKNVYEYRSSDKILDVWHYEKNILKICFRRSALDYTYVSYLVMNNGKINLYSEDDFMKFDTQFDIHTMGSNPVFTMHYINKLTNHQRYMLENQTWFVGMLNIVEPRMKEKLKVVANYFIDQYFSRDIINHIILLYLY